MKSMQKKKGKRDILMHGQVLHFYKKKYSITKIVNNIHTGITNDDILEEITIRHVVFIII